MIHSMSTIKRYHGTLIGLFAYQNGPFTIKCELVDGVYERFVSTFDGKIKERSSFFANILEDYIVYDDIKENPALWFMGPCYDVSILINGSQCTAIGKSIALHNREIEIVGSVIEWDIFDKNDFKSISS